MRNDIIAEPTEVIKSTDDFHKKKRLVSLSYLKQT